MATILPSRGLVVWLTGLSGAGKTTLAERLEQELKADGHGVYRLDGDILRKGLCSDLGFSLVDRRENIRRAGEVACLLADAGLIAVAALISPFQADRQLIRERLAPRRFIEVYVNAPLEVCERRDVKGLYRRARAGTLAEFTGISSPYEAPASPEVEVRTDRLSIEECVARLKSAVIDRLRLPASV